MEPNLSSSFSKARDFALLSSVYSPQIQKYPSSLFLFFLSVFCLLTPPIASRIVVNPRIPINPNPLVSYSKYCNHVVPESPPDPNASFADSIFRLLAFRVGFFTGGDGLFDKQTSDAGLPKSASLFPYYSHKTLSNNNVYKINARLTLRTPRSFSSSGDWLRRRLRGMRFRGPSIQTIGRGSPGFGLTGFWSESTGQLCMVGSGVAYTNAGNSRSFDVVLKLNYSTNSSIYGSLVSGILESLDEKHNLGSFEPVSILGVAQNDGNYEYKLIQKGSSDWCLSEGESLSITGLEKGVCSVLTDRVHRFGLEYADDCGTLSCNPLTNNVAYVPSFMSLMPIRCSDQNKMRMAVSFHNSTVLSNTFPFDPSTTFMAEGAWDEKKNRFCAVACKILNFTNSLAGAVVGDCSVKLSLRFPAVLSIRRMSAIVGEVWSDRPKNKQDYFSRIRFWSLKEALTHFPGLRYEYTDIERVRTICTNKNNALREGKSYPDGHSLDMRFPVSVKNSKGATVSGYATPLFVGNQLYESPLVANQGATQTGVAVSLSHNHSSLVKISYRMRFSSEFKFRDDNHTPTGVEIYAEGLYDRETGVLCMTGCRPLGPSNGEFKRNYSLDCDLVVNIQFSPSNTQSSNRVKGTIESTRKKSDPLYFGRIDLWSNSISTGQAKESLWRMDLEITMVLISNTLTCVFVGLQLYHGNKHPEILPFISIIMLVVLTLGHMIPLLLNFEALFKTNHDQQYMFMGNGGWLEVNEIIVRMVTMVAFLLEFRLLQLSWNARRDEERGFWVSDKKALCVSLPFYVAGGLIAWFVNLLKHSPQSSYLQPGYKGYALGYQRQLYQQRSLWGVLKSYGGLVLDGFLIPQILFNAFSNTKEKALAASFYLGTTLVRLLPHSYDLYRAHSSAGYFDWSFVYANHKIDFYSTAWDIIILFAGLLFAILVFLQQWFGGQCILPKRFKSGSMYEKVPTVTSEELQDL